MRQMLCLVILVSIGVSLFAAAPARNAGKNAGKSAATAATPEIPSHAIAQKGKQLLADDFGRSEMGVWKAVIPSAAIADGALKVWQTREDHGGVGKIPVKYKDAIFEFRFKTGENKSFSIGFDDKQYKGSHAGHIASIGVSPDRIRLNDSKEGVMRLDIYEARKGNDPAKKKEAEKALVGRTANFPVKISGDDWHTLSIEMAGDAMRVTLDGKPAAYLKSSGIGHPTKDLFGFTVSGKEVLFDDVKIWEATPVGGAE